MRLLGEGDSKSSLFPKRMSSNCSPVGIVIDR